jgi:hypothetical protein
MLLALAMVATLGVGLWIDPVARASIARTFTAQRRSLAAYAVKVLAEPNQ